MDDFLQVLNWGEIAEHNWSETHECYECKVVGKDIEGDDLTLIIAVDEKNFRIRCITVE